MLIAMRSDYRWLRLLSLPAMLGAGVLLALVLFSPWRVEVSGSTQWLKLPGLPSSSPVSSRSSPRRLPRALDGPSRRRDRLDPGRLVPFVAIVAPFLILIFKSPDSGRRPCSGSS